MRLAIFALAFVAGPAFAQVHRCDDGNGPVFQQGPCPGGADGALPAGPSPMEASKGVGPGKALCAEVAALTFGNGARIVVTRRWGTEIVKFRGARETAITYELSIDERSEHHGYGGPRPFYCFVDTQERRVFRIAAPVQRQAF